MFFLIEATPNPNPLLTKANFSSRMQFLAINAHSRILQLLESDTFKFFYRFPGQGEGWIAVVEADTPDELRLCVIEENWVFFSLFNLRIREVAEIVSSTDDDSARLIFGATIGDGMDGSGGWIPSTDENGNVQPPPGDALSDSLCG